MTIRWMASTFSLAFAVTLAAATTAKAQALPSDVPGLRNLDAELHRTGEVAVPATPVEGNGILDSASIAAPPETRVRSLMVSPPEAAPTRISLRDDPLLDSLYGSAFATSLEACRVDVARQLRVSPAEVAAGIVTLRWTLEPSGRVRDVSVVAQSPTDGAVMACANVVVASRVLLSPVERPVALEWTYAFRTIRAITKKNPASQVPNEH
jgi:hypothetical protein